MPDYVWLILFIAGIVVSFIGAKKVALRAFCKEFGEAFLALDEFLGKKNPTKEDAEKLKKEWLEAIHAMGKLFGKIATTIDMKQYKKNRRT